MQTVRESFEGYTKNEVKKAITAREAPTMLGCLSERDMEYLVSSKELDDCPVTPHDLRNANAIFGGPDIAGVRGKTVRRAPERVITDYVAIPRDFLKLHTHVTLVADVMFVNNIPFLVTLSRGIKFVTAEHVRSRTAKQLAKSIKRVMQLYGRAGMIVQTVLMDMEFDKTVDELSDRTVVNTSAAQEHVAEIERQI